MEVNDIDPEFSESHAEYKKVVLPVSPPIKTVSKDHIPDFTKQVGILKIYLFVNYISGGNRGKSFTALNADKILFQIQEPPVELNIHALNDEDSRNNGFRKLRAEPREVKVIIAGGDGSVMWAFETMLAFHIEPAKCPMGVLPFGTGNDLAAMLGWGRTPPRSIVGKHMKSLQKLVKQWANAVPQPLDIWDIEVDVDSESGYFTKIGNGEKTELKDKDGNRMLTYRRLMINYFSFGIDARIGLNFEKRRAKKTWINKLIYCWEGFKKSII
jgi:diacylglycerol kinase (ATP)